MTTKLRSLAYTIVIQFVDAVAYGGGSGGGE